MLLDLVVAALIALGLFFFFAGVVGVLRFPDFYTRLHAASKCDSLAAVLVLLAIAIHQWGTLEPAQLLVGIKILLIAAFVFVASPTATHAITEAALIAGVEPWSPEEETE